MSDSQHVKIFDTTLRDGEQSPGATMTSGEKLEVARTLSRLGVDVIEAGFPAASPDDLLAVETIAEQIGGAVVPGRPQDEPPTICALARAKKGDIDKALLALSPAVHPRIHTFLATSPIHREHKLRMSRQQVLAQITDMVGYAAARCPDVEFSPEDAGRTERDFLCQAVEAAIEAGARTINIPDTVGYTTPEEFGATIKHLVDNIDAIREGRVIVSVHCHNDLGLATANTLAGLINGARQAEVTINGIGERAGNTALEEIVMALRTRATRYGLHTLVDTTQIARASKLVSTVTGMMVQPNKAIVGDNAFAHEAGIHQDGMLKHEETYEIMRPETVGVSATQLVLGKHSGRHAFAVRLRELGYDLSDSDLNDAFARFKAVAERKKYVTDADLAALLQSELFQPAKLYALEDLQVACGTMKMPTATVRLIGPEGLGEVHATVGTGPVDAVFKAIEQAVGGLDCQLLEYSVNAVTEGIDALGEVSVRIRGSAGEHRTNPQSGDESVRMYHGYGADTDIIVASAKAYLAAVNRLLLAKDRPARAGGDVPRAGV